MEDHTQPNLNPNPGEHPQGESPLPAAASRPAQAPAGEPNKYPFSFRGSGSEFFRIWIVNVALTVLTFGIYTPWARVRTRRYFYGNTFLNDRNFTYLANPLDLLKGFVIIIGGLILYNVSGALLPPLAAVIALVFMGVFPWLIYKSLRFKCHNSAYSNVRLRFRGECSEAYGIYLGLLFLMPFTLGLILPYQAYRAKQYVFGNLALGKSESATTIGPGRFYYIYLVVPALIFLTIGILAGISIPVFKAISDRAKASSEASVTPGADLQEASFADTTVSGMNSAAPRAIFAQLEENTTTDTPDIVDAPEDGDEIPDFENLDPALIAGIVVGYIVFILFFILLQQYIFVRATNYTLTNTTLGSCRLYSNMRARDMIWIFASNIFLILLTIGLYTPWAIVRLRKYQFEHMAVFAYGDLQEFVAAEEVEQSAIGDAAGDYFDFEIGF